MHHDDFLQFENDCSPTGSVDFDEFVSIGGASVQLSAPIWASVGRDWARSGARPGRAWGLLHEHRDGRRSDRSTARVLHARPNSPHTQYALPSRAQELNRHAAWAPSGYGIRDTPSKPRLRRHGRDEALAMEPANPVHNRCRRAARRLLLLAPCPAASLASSK